LEQKPQIKDFPVKSLVCGFLVGIAAQSRNHLGWWSRHIGEKNRAVYNAVEGNTTFLSCFGLLLVLTAAESKPWIEHHQVHQALRTKRAVAGNAS
jgi:hypothetical protein